MSLENRVAVITGATGELGKSVTERLGNMGVNIALLGRDLQKLAALGKGVSLPDSHLMTHPVDLIDSSAIKKAAEMVVARFGRVDILLHLIGGWTGGKTLVDSNPEDLAFMLNQHVWTSYHVIQAFIPHIQKNGWGRVVMISSPFAEQPVARGGLYAAGKAGQEALVKTLSQEVKGSGVTANLLLVKTIDKKREKVSSPTLENASWTTPEEITSAILFLLSDEGGSINGARIPVYGSNS